MINYYLLIPVLLLGFVFFAQTGSTSKYSYLFRNTILSKSGDYELAPVLRGRVYYPRYFYVPTTKQYLVYSSLDERGPFRVYGTERKKVGKSYSLLDEKGKVLLAFETPLVFSSRSGCFYGGAFYIPLAETGKMQSQSYHKIYNADLELNQTNFNELFRELYATSDYVEYVRLRDSFEDVYESGIVFKRNGNIEILLSGVRDSRMSRRFQENELTNNSDDYFVPAISNVESFPQSEPEIEIISLETSDANPFVHSRIGFHSEFSVTKYRNEYSSGWNGIAKFGIIPIYVSGESFGMVYARFKTRGEVFKIKIIDVQKFGPTLNLGLRSFQLPKNKAVENGLVFMESVQNCGDNRLGGGVFVVRSATTTNPLADIPSDMTEARFNSLPLTLQEALLDPESCTALKIYAKNSTEWFPEIERLKNLTHLEMSTGMTEVPDEISKLTKLEYLSMESSKVQRISPEIVKLKELKKIDLFYNKLTEFPRVLLELQKLDNLNISSNSIHELPDDINRLQNLKYLSISGNGITKLPESMIGMKKLFIDSMGMEDDLPAEYQHLFDWDKLN